ncbi:hypothetical protein VF14_15875 [Nostoc linckia z18]|uniref:Uncharacterized protein n=2 Tax=Nostoc linckia TaxID=92942 RepID=A0A9Q6EM15_NOSLI|nr:hypothetical protein [Nostoc linckia]PHK40695.1 hypothetical protein VF12_09360 [Nostoc linckia z15]PHK48264.1 hypothetical protein VF13_00680 [Nostoc linckia z16]PHJ60931.1 hypothetical protein VF02_21055 [Nostoc linckia z1]PHJ64667.1 hypothetical protein VF05_22265 [Nostoc linckia z3]PHJ71522.1 hypothetical protein VF03_19900 [Nostoc linckia z2]
MDNLQIKILGKIAICITLLIGVAILIISIYPGALNSFFFPVMLVSIVCVPFAVLAILFWGLRTLGRRDLKSIRLRRQTFVPWREVAIIAGIVLVCYVLLKFYIPRRLAFMISRSAFEQVRVKLPISAKGKITLNRKLGLYEVDEYAMDSRGGAYFRVFSGGDGLSPDTISYGFVHQPNSEGSPFGAAKYQVFYLYGDWYWFRVSDDF